MSNIYGDDTLSEEPVHCWVQQFKDDRESTEDDPLLKTERMQENIDNVNISMLDDRRYMLEEISKISGLNQSTVQAIVHQTLSLTKVIRRFPKFLLENKRQ